MANANPARRPPATGVESLESRTLFVATPGPNFAAVLSHVQEVAASHLRMSEHVEQSAISLSTAKQAVADAGANGKALIAADKAALKAAAGDEAAELAAREKLAIDKAQAKADLVAAKANVRAVQAGARATGATLRADMKADRALLNAELKSSDGPARAAARKLVNDWQAMQIGSDLTSHDMQELADSLKRAADGATQPSAESISTLRVNAVAVFADGVMTDAESDALLVDLKNVFLTADVSEAEAEDIAADVEVVVDKLALTPDQLAVIVRDLQITLAAFSGA